MKIAVLIFIIFIIIVIFRFFSSINKKKYSNNKEENVIDLEKDPNSDEYKPKEWLMFSLQLIIMELQISDVIEILKETLYQESYGL